MLFAIFARRSLGEGGHGANFIKYWRDRDTKFLSGRVFIPLDEFGKRHWRSVAVQFISDPEICHGTGFLLRADARIRVTDYLPVPASGSESCKKHDKQLTFIVRVMRSLFFLVHNYDYIPFFVSFVYIPMSLYHLFKRIASVYNRF